MGALKVKPLRRLYFQFGRLLSPRLDASEVFWLLKRAGLVEAVALSGAGEVTHYRETEKLKEISPKDFERTVLRALKGEK